MTDVKELASQIEEGSKLAYTYAEASVAVGFSAESLRLQMVAGKLKGSFLGRKPVFMREELVRWLRALPDEPTR